MGQSKEEQHREGGIGGEEGEVGAASLAASATLSMVAEAPSDLWRRQVVKK